MAEQGEWFVRILLLLLALLTTRASAHELWIEPVDFQPPADSKIAANIVNGQKFEGFRIAYLPRKFSTFSVFAGERYEPVESRIGDTPALDQDTLGDGLHVVVYQSKPDTVNYAEFEKFQAFADHKDFPDIRQRHLARELPEMGFREVYTRYSKSLIGVGEAAGEDKRIGMETEFVALDNPYASDLSDGLRVQLFYAGNVRADAQVELFERAQDGDVTITLLRTDVHGIATLPVSRGRDYMVDAVVLRQPDAKMAKETGAVWESLWANMTFAVPN